MTSPYRIVNFLNLLLAVSFPLACFKAVAQEKEIRLYDGPAPGSENWTQSEQVNLSNRWNTRLVFNVTNPTLTVFQSIGDRTNGTGLIICPGGGFIALSIDSEGFEVGRWLAAKGVTCFVLKYRLVECKTNDPTTPVASRDSWDATAAPVVKMALADANTAIAYARKHAVTYGINPSRIGIIGFSAGGTVAASASMNYTAETRPNFTALIYPNYGRAIKTHGVPIDAPPLFVLAASDDHLGLGPDSLKVYQDWITAGKHAELHMYSKGGHGFGMRDQHLPSDHWIDRFADWVKAQDFLN